MVTRLRPSALQNTDRSLQANQKIWKYEESIFTCNITKVVSWTRELCTEYSIATNAVFLFDDQLKFYDHVKQEFLIPTQKLISVHLLLNNKKLRYILISFSS